MVVGLFFYHGRTNRRFVPYSPPWARLTSNRFTIAGRWMVGMAYWVACLPSRHAVAFESNNRLTASPTSIRAVLCNAPNIDLFLTRHQGVIQVVRQTIDKMPSRWDARCLGVVLVSVWNTRAGRQGDVGMHDMLKKLMWGHQECQGDVSLSHDNVRSVHINRQTERTHRRRTEIHTVIIPRATQWHIGNENRPGWIEFQIDLHGERQYVGRYVYSWWSQYVGRYVCRCEKSIRELAKYAPKSAQNCHIFQIIDLPYWAIFFCTWQNFRIIWRIQNIMDCLKAISNKDFPQNHKFQQSRQIRLFLITFISFSTTKNRYGPKTK